MLDVCCFKWATPGYRSTFGPETVNTLARMVARHFHREHRFTCITDDPAGIDPTIRVIPLWKDWAHLQSPHGGGNPACYRRLKLYSPEARTIIGERILALDLDVVITGDVTPLWDRSEDFVIWGDTAPGTPYNGSMVLMTAGCRAQVWETFDPIESPKAATKLGYWGSDQAWISCCLGPNERIWTWQDGVYSFRNHMIVRGRPGILPSGARIVIFHGKFDPWEPEVQRTYGWIKMHYW